MIAQTPEPPYYAVIFTSVRNGRDEEGYAAMAERMLELAALQPGFLGLEAARNGLGITVSYWRDEESIIAWRKHAEHGHAQHLGRTSWYSSFVVRVAKVERDNFSSAAESLKPTAASVEGPL